MMADKGLVIAAVDLSEIAPAVVRAGFASARRLGTRLVVLHALEALRGEEGSGPLLPSLRRKVDRMRQEGRRNMDRLLAKAGLSGTEGVTARLVEGRAWRQILQRAHPVEVSLVVLGSPRPGPILGSTAHHLILHCEVPVLIVRRPPRDGYRKVLVGVDFSPASARAWEGALGMCGTEAEAIACHAMEGDSLPSESDRKEMETTLSDWALARTRRVSVRCRLGAGPARSVLLEAARAEGVDLLAVGNRCHGLVADLVTESLAEAVAKEGVCDVLVVGPSRTESR